MKNSQISHHSTRVSLRCPGKMEVPRVSSDNEAEGRAILRKGFKLLAGYLKEVKGTRSSRIFCMLLRQMQ